MYNVWNAYFFSFFQWSSSPSEPEYYQTCDICIRRQGGMWLTKNVIFTVKTMMWMLTHEPAPPWTLQVWEHLLTLLTSYSMFELLKGSMSFGGSVFWRMDIWNFWSWLLFVLVVAGVRYICDGMPIRWWTILYITTIFALVLLCCRVGHFSSFNIDVTLLSLE